MSSNRVGAKQTSPPKSFRRVESMDDEILLLLHRVFGWSWKATAMAEPFGRTEEYRNSGKADRRPEIISRQAARRLSQRDDSLY